MTCYPSRNHLLIQIWTFSGVLISIAAQGMMLGYVTLLPALKDSSADLHEASWTASRTTCVLIGVLLSSILMEVLGRKLAYMTLTLPGPIGLLLIYSGSSLSVTEAGGMLGDVTCGGTVMLGAVVIGEYSSPENRGMFLNLKTAALAFGSSVSRVLCIFCHWRTIALIILIFYVISLLIVSTWLESPAWLVMKGQIEISERNFYSLRGRNSKSQTEFEEMIKVQSDGSMKAKKSSYVEILRKFTKRSFMRPVFIMFMGFVLLEMSGRHIFPLYASHIIEDMGGSNSPFDCALTIDIIITVGATLSAIFIKFMKTRTLLFSTGAASLLVLLTANTYLCLSSNNIISNNHPWLPTAMFILYFTIVNLGCITVPMALVGEIFPLAHKGTGLFVTGFISYLCLGVTINIFPYLLASLKIYSTFVITGMIKTLILMILFIVLPETKNKTLQEIEDNIKYGRVDESKIFGDYDERYRMLNAQT